MTLNDADLQLIWRIITSLQQLILFYSKNYGELNLDGLFGLRIIEGQLGICAKISPMDFEVHEKLLEQRNEVRSVANSAMEQVYKNDPAYFRKLPQLAQLPWISTGPIETLENSYLKLLWAQNGTFPVI